MQTSAIEFIRAMNSSGLAIGMLINIVRNMQRNEGAILIHYLLKIRKSWPLQKILRRKSSLMHKSKFRQAKILEEKDKDGSSDELISKDKEILAAEEKFKREKGAYSYLVKSIKGC